MNYLSIILSLASAVTALDAVIHTNSQYCEGRWVGCLNLNPNTCCSTSERGQSASFRAIPDWYVETRSYREPGCDERWRSYANWNGKRDGSYFCNSLGNYHSVGYGILGRKREEGGVAPSECEKPNAMGLEDGTQYNLTAMDDTLVGELLGYKEAKGAADIPELFQEFVM